MNESKYYVPRIDPETRKKLEDLRRVNCHYGSMLSMLKDIIKAVHDPEHIPALPIRDKNGKIRLAYKYENWPPRQ